MYVRRYPDEGAPLPVSSAGGAEQPYHANYDVAPDGTRLLISTRTVDDASPSRINVVLNWAHELHRSTPEE